MAFQVFDNRFAKRPKQQQKNKTITNLKSDLYTQKNRKKKLSNKCACMLLNAKNVCTCVNKLSYIRCIWNIQSICYVQYLSFVLYVVVAAYFSAAFDAVVFAVVSWFQSETLVRVFYVFASNIRLHFKNSFHRINATLLSHWDNKELTKFKFKQISSLKLCAWRAWNWKIGGLFFDRWCVSLDDGHHFSCFWNRFTMFSSRFPFFNLFSYFDASNIFRPPCWNFQFRGSRG